jgi:hypothetical protein
MKLEASTIKSLEKLLLAELVEYDTYLKLLDEEQGAVVKLDSDRVVVLGAQRGEVGEKLSQLKEERSKLIASAIGNDAYRASEVIQQGCSAGDRRRLMGLVEKIRAKIKEVELKSREFNQVLSFSLGLVNGELSLLWSASQPVSRVYNAFGSMSQGVQPAPPRNGSLLGEA